MPPFLDTTAFFHKISKRERLDVLSDEEIVRLRQQNFDEVYERACKIIPDMMFKEFADYTSQEYYADIVQCACIGVLKAVESWKPSGGSSLTTWAYRLARQHVWKQLHKEFGFYEHHELHDFNEVYEDEAETIMHRSDSDDEPVPAGERAMQWQAEYSLLYHTLDSDSQSVLEMLRNGFTQQEIANDLAVSQSTVSRIVAKIQQHILEIGE